MTLYKSDKHSGLFTRATDGSLIRFTDGYFTATKKAQRDVLDKLTCVRVVREDKPEPAKPATKKAETATKAAGAKPAATRKATPTQRKTATPAKDAK